MITRTQFDTLAAATNDYAVSIFVPTYRVGNQQEDQIRFKNALKKAEEKLISRYALSEREAETFMQPAHDLEQQPDFWSDQSDGLAVFIAKNTFEYYTCPVDFEPMVYVAPEFYLRPLIPVLGDDTMYYLLALSKGDIRLYSASQYTIAPVDLQGQVPANIDDALMQDDPQQHTSRAGGAEGQRGSNNGVFFSRGGDPTNDVEDIKAYFDRVDKGVTEFLSGNRAPLVLGGVEALIPIYHEANGYAHLHEDGFVAGNLELESLPMLHEKSWPIIEHHFHAQAERDDKLYGDNLANGEAGSDLETIVPAAINGRIAALWLDRKHYAYGEYNAETNGVTIMTDEDKNATELLNLAAVRAFESGARVYNVDADKLPGGAAGSCAIYRYTVGAVTTNL